MKKIYLILFTVFLSSCITQQAVFKDYSTDKIIIPFKASEIIIEDLRINKQPMNWNLPAVAAKEFEITGNPEIGTEDKNMLVKLIKDSENPEGIPAKITLKLNEGTCKIFADWSQAKEFAKVVMEVEVEELNTGRILKSSSEVFYDYKTLNALEKSVIKTYNIALKNATHQSLNQLTKHLN
jgi:hypothetical protein